MIAAREALGAEGWMPHCGNHASPAGLSLVEGSRQMHYRLVSGVACPFHGVTQRDE